VGAALFQLMTMSCCLQGGEQESSKKISKELKDEGRKRLREVKLLLLGTGDSGKSTIAKQFRILYLNGYSDFERANFIPAIHSNLLYAIKELIKGVLKFGYEVDNTLKGSAAILLKVSTTACMTKEIGDQIKYLWNDPAIRDALKRRNELQLVEQVEYLMDKIDYYADPSYIPTIEDILRVRVRTTGIMELKFQIENLIYRVMDMGGQRSERRKWMHFFEGTNAIIYVGALNEYNLNLREDEKVNRMQESLQLFNETANNAYFETTPIILFLNKSDLFREKIKTISIRVCFPEYTGTDEYEESWRFICQQYFNNSSNRSRIIYPHVICATDTDTVKRIFDDVRSSLINDSLRDVGII